MRLFSLIERSVSQRPLSSILTALSVALGVMLVIAILHLREELSSTYLKQGQGYDLVVGPQGSPLQLVLNSIFHIDQSPGLMPLSVYREFAAPANERYVRLALPYAVGDSFRGYRVVATTDGIFSDAFPYPKADTVEGRFAAGRPFHYAESHLDEALVDLGAPAVKHEHHEGDDHDHHDHEGGHAPFEAVLGAEVAATLNLKIGDKIEPTHGVEGGKAHEHEHLWTVTGILKRSGTPIDRVVWINLDSFYRIGEHAKGAILPQTKEAAISALVLFPREGYAKAFLLANLKKRGDVQVAEVAKEIKDLLSIVGNVDQAFLIVAILVVVIGVVSVLVAIYNTMNERRRELAILRAIGARRSTLLLAVVGEAALLSLLGGLLGAILAHAGLFAFSDQIREVSGLAIKPLRVLPAEFIVIVGVIVTGSIAGLIPAFKAYTTDVAKNLAPLS